MKKHYDIMVIDDEQVILDAVLRICSAQQYTVDTSLEAGRALEKIENNGYRLILCDLMLPDIDGFRFLELMQEKEIDVPVIMTTGYSTMENAVKSLHKGAIDFIPKPFTADELCSGITRGLKYLEIKNLEKKKSAESVPYVPCPPRYFRFGYSSWISKDHRGVIAVGATDLFLKTIQSVEDIEMMTLDEEMVQGSYCATIKSQGEAKHPILAPLSGRIVECNELVIKDRTKLEKDPYFQGWLYKIIPSDFDFENKHLVSCGMNMI